MVVRRLTAPPVIGQPLSAHRIDGAQGAPPFTPTRHVIGDQRTRRHDECEQDDGEIDETRHGHDQVEQVDCAGKRQKAYRTDRSSDVVGPVSTSSVSIKLHTVELVRRVAEGGRPREPASAGSSCEWLMLIGCDDREKLLFRRSDPMTQPFRFPAGILACLVLAGCGGTSPTAPWTPSTPTSPSTSTTAQLTGTVSDNSGSRLPSSTVQITTGPNTGLTVTADPAGIYRFEVIQTGTITLVARAMGFADSTRSVTVNATGPNTLNFTLTGILSATDRDGRTGRSLTPHALARTGAHDRWEIHRSRRWQTRDRDWSAAAPGQTRDRRGKTPYVKRLL